MFNKNDLVTRKSYNNDIVFKILFISNNIAVLKGVDVRLCADAKIEDLTKHELTRDIDEDDVLPIKSGNYLNGKVLHIDSDSEYLKRSMKLYEKYKVPSVGYRFKEYEMPDRIGDLLVKYHPDILIITGHDAIDKHGENVNTSYFVKCVNIARTYQPSKDALCIISGACYSSFKDLIYEGSNFSLSTGLPSKQKNNSTLS
jgi:spore coat assembly protein